MGSMACRSCCSDQRLEVPHLPEVSISKEDGPPMWEEVLNDAKLSSKLWDATVSSSATEGRGCHRLEFNLRGLRQVGLQLQLLPLPEPALVVAGVEPEGELTRNADGGPGVCPGDIVMEVQKQAGAPAELFEQLQRLSGSSGRAPLVIRQRPRSFSVDLARKGKSWQRLGLSVSLKPDNPFVLVAAVHENGLAAEWNQKHNQHCVCIGDRIISVNGRRGSAIDMYALVQATSFGGVLQLQVEPPPRNLVPMITAWAATAVTQGDCLETL